MLIDAYSDFHANHNHFFWKVIIRMIISLTHWGHICVSKLTIIGSDNGLSPDRRQANIWTNAGILLIGTLGTNFSVILSEIHTFSFKKMHLKTSSAKRRPFCLGLNVLTLNKRIADVNNMISCWIALFHMLNTLRLRQNGPNFLDDIFKYIFLNENI